MHQQHRVLVTDRLHLRRFTAADANHLFDLDSDPEVMRYLSGGTPTPRAVIEAEILPRFISAHHRWPGFGFWAAIGRATGQFLGWFSLRPIRDANPRVAALGFRLRRVAWGQGYATEGLLALIRLAFTGLGVVRLVATTYEENLASRRVMEKAGMVLTRRLRFTPADLADVDTFSVDAAELWAGDDLEYSLEQRDWTDGRNRP